MSKIYIAGKFEEQAIARAARTILEEKGHEVTSSWLDETPVDHAMTTEEEWRTIAYRDLRDLRAADTVVVLNAESGGCGMWIELGYALASPMVTIYLVGELKGEGRRVGGQRSVFCHLFRVTKINSVEEVPANVNQYC